MGGALSLDCSEFWSSWRGALGIAEASGAGNGIRAAGPWHMARVLVQVFAVFGVGFISKSKLKMTCGAGKNRTKNGNKKAKKSR